MDTSSLEFREAKRIVEVVLKKIYPLIKGKLRGNNQPIPTNSPSSIDELLQVTDKNLRAIIKEALGNLPNRTCVADPDKLCGFCLKYLDIVTRGAKREKFIAIGKVQVHKMIRDGIINVYTTGTNERYKLLG